MIVSDRMGLRPCIRRENLARNCRLGYLLGGWALRPSDRREKPNRNRRVGYLLLGWALRL